jgi:hypothetical protein
MSSSTRTTFSTVHLATAIWLKSTLRLPQRNPRHTPHPTLLMEGAQLDWHHEVLQVLHWDPQIRIGIEIIESLELLH